MGVSMGGVPAGSLPGLRDSSICRTKEQLAREHERETGRDGRTQTCERWTHESDATGSTPRNDHAGISQAANLI